MAKVVGADCVGAVDVEVEVVDANVQVMHHAGMLAGFGYMAWHLRRCKRNSRIARLWQGELQHVKC